MEKARLYQDTTYRNGEMDHNMKWAQESAQNTEWLGIMSNHHLRVGSNQSVVEGRPCRPRRSIGSIKQECYPVLKCLCSEQLNHV